jgi:hypothetical protein
MPATNDCTLPSLRGSPRCCKVCHQDADSLADGGAGSPFIKHPKGKPIVCSRGGRKRRVRPYLLVCCKMRNWLVLQEKK